MPNFPFKRQRVGYPQDRVRNSHYSLQYEMICVDRGQNIVLGAARCSSAFCQPSGTTANRRPRYAQWRIIAHYLRGTQAVSVETTVAERCRVRRRLQYSLPPSSIAWNNLFTAAS